MQCAYKNNKNNSGFLVSRCNLSEWQLWLLTQCLWSFIFFHLFLVYHGKKKFQKTIRQTNSIQTKSPQTETLRTFDILHDDSIPFTNVERFRQKWVYTGWKLKTKVLSWEIHTHTQTQTHTHTHLNAHTNTHHQQACGSTKSVWRCSDVKDMSAGIHLNNSHTHNLSLLPLCWLYS